jgi:hypothetical protein
MISSTCFRQLKSCVITRMAWSGLEIGKSAPLSLADPPASSMNRSGTAATVDLPAP